MWIQTRDVDGGSSINNAAIWAYTVSAWCSSLDFKTHISFCGVGELQIRSDNICKGPWETHRETVQWLKMNLEKGIHSYIYISSTRNQSRVEERHIRYIPCYNIDKIGCILIILLGKLYSHQTGHVYIFPSYICIWRLMVSPAQIDHPRLPISTAISRPKPIIPESLSPSHQTPPWK